jgi:hypothetical protein
VVEDLLGAQLKLGQCSGYNTHTTAMARPKILRLFSGFRMASECEYLIHVDGIWIFAIILHRWRPYYNTNFNSLVHYLSLPTYLVLLRLTARGYQIRILHTRRGIKLFRRSSANSTARTIITSKQKPARSTQRTGSCIMMCL